MRPKLAVLGSPIGHSLSPAIHGAAYRMLDLDWEYGARDVSEEGLGAFLASLEEDWVGLSLTMPLKRAVVPMLQDRSAQVDRLGVANTVRFTYAADGDRLLSGYNTDVAGISVPLRDTGRAFGSAALLGGGATAMSATAALAQLGVTALRVVSRSAERSRPVLDLARRLGIAATHAPLAERYEASDEDLIVSTLPGPAAAGHHVLPPSRGRELPVLFDISYDPWPPTLASAWRAHGGVAFTGLDMLVEQAVEQVRIFVTGDEGGLLPDVPQMRQAMMDAAFAALTQRKRNT